MAKKILSILLVIILCALCSGCDENSKNVVKCANCGVEIEMHSEKAAIIAGTLGGDNGVLCSDCSDVGPEDYIANFLN
ncbi:MAG: hypothetical protein E7580_04285 [Ruminococcaceae bacterium]|nr:hypothetical protein [Oscillospiraceae bacterium]